ncbi:MAG: hypothetical protein ACYC6K_07765 [Bellilinea sp.]
MSWFKQNIWGCLLTGAILLAFGIFLITLADYGASYDEPLFYEYADRMVDAYKKMAFGEGTGPLLDFYDLPFYGPAYLIIGRSAIGLIRLVFPGLEIYNAWHTINFATFLLGGILVYWLTRRIASKPASFIAASLYFTQPLLWGHGVMNPKDIPFMTAFLAVVVTGSKMVDRFNHPGVDQRTQNGLKTGRSRGRKVATLIALVLGGILFTDRAFGNFLFQPVVRNLVSLVVRLYSDALLFPFTDYLSKAIKALNFAEFVILLGFGLAGLVVFLHKSSPKVRWLILAGILSGLTMAIRVLGPAAMALVLVYAFMVKTKNWWRLALGYILITLAVAYSAWPFLWDNPISGLSESFNLMSAFPWNGSIRFEGNNFLPNELPFYYLPKLLTIQLTLPLILCALVGTLVLVDRIRKKEANRASDAVLLVWFWVPLLAVMVLRPNLYDNFRQFLFILPPLFAVAGAAVEEIPRRVNRPAILASLVALGLLPGIAAGIWLHPYEYVYYNALVGWTGSIERRYETDYWGTAMCETGKFVSSQTTKASLVVLNDEILRRLFERCSTHALDIRLDPAETLKSTPDFAVFLSRFDHDQTYYQKLEPLLTVQRGKTIFAVVKGKP